MEEIDISYLVCNLKKIRNWTNNKIKDNVTPIELENERDENYSPDNPSIDLSKTSGNYHYRQDVEIVYNFIGAVEFPDFVNIEEDYGLDD